MTSELSVDLRASIEWLLQETGGLSSIADSARASYTQTLAAGVGSGEADRIWYDQRTLAAGASDDLDLTSLSRTIFDASVVVSLVRVKAVLLINTSSGAGETLLLGAAAAQCFAEPFDGNTSVTLAVPAGAACLLTHPLAGWEVQAGVADRLAITNTGAADATYSIVVAGTSA